VALPFAMSGVAPGKLSKKERLRDKEEETLSPLSGGLRKKRRRGLGKPDPTAPRGRKPIKFGADFSSESDSQDDDHDEVTKKDTPDGPISATPVIRQQDRNLTDAPPARTFSSSAPTLVERGKATKATADPLATLDYEKEIEAVKGKLRRTDADIVDGEVEYSDYEEDVPSKNERSGKSFTTDRDGEHWSPAFLVRHQTQLSPRKPTPGPPMAQIVPGAMPVPATPSLIKAIDRIAIAQKDAFGIAGTVPVKDPAKLNPVSEAADVGVTTNRTERAPRWEEFWREVRVKAQS
jgi:hypothetical protein